MVRQSEVEALEAVLEGLTAPDDAPRSLNRLASLATAVRDHTEVETPSDDFRTRLRVELLEVAAEGRPASLRDRVADRVDVATARVRHSLRAAGAAAVASSLIGTAGVAAAAQSALPGDVLYSVKGLTEDARLAFASGDVERGRLHLGYARERLDEVEVGRDRLSPDQLTTSLDQLDREAAAGADELLGAAADGQGPTLLDELDEFTAEVRGRLLDLSPDLPLSVRPAAERSLEVLRRIDLQVTGLFGLDGPSCPACGDASGVQPRVVLPGDGPAAPSCLCVRPAPAVDHADADDGPDETGPVEQPQSGPTDASAPGSGGPAVPGGDGTLQTGTSGEDLVGGVGSVVDDAVDEVTDPLDDLGSLVDDVLDPTSTTTDGGLVGDTSSSLTDAVGDVGDAVEDTASDLGSRVDDLGSEVTDLGDGLLD